MQYRREIEGRTGIRLGEREFLDELVCHHDARSFFSAKCPRSAFCNPMCRVISETLFGVSTSSGGDERWGNYRLTHCTSISSISSCGIYGPEPPASAPTGSDPPFWVSWTLPVIIGGGPINIPAPFLYSCSTGYIFSNAS
jgi:hypothetical protein